MTGQQDARIESVTITTGGDARVFTVGPEAEVPQSVTVTMAGGKKITVNAGGAHLGSDQTITVSADGAISVTRCAKAPEADAGTGARGVQFGNGNTQVNSW
jgi:hypothetical protein